MQFKMGEFAILWKARCMFLFGKYFGKCNRPFSGWDPGYWLSGSQHQIGIAHWVKILGVKRACLSKSVPLTIGIQWFLRREVVPLKTLHFDSRRSFETMNRLSNIQGSSNSRRNIEFTLRNTMHRSRTRVPQPKGHNIKFTLPNRSVSRASFLFVQRLSQYWPCLSPGHRYVYFHCNFTVYSKQNQVMYYHCHFTLTVH